MAEHPTVGLVIPAYQMEPWLGPCLRSVTEQSRPPEEIVVVDDGSTDATGDIAASVPGVTVIRQRNRGVAAARNTGARATTTDWLFFLDADDVLLGDALDRLRDAVTRFPRAAAVNPGYEVALPDGRIAPPARRVERSFDRSDLWEVIRANPFAGNMLIRRDVAEEYPYDETLRGCQDLDLWCRLLLDDHPIVQLADGHIRRTEGRPGALTRKILLMRRDRRAIFLKLWRERNLSPTERAVLAYQIGRVTAGIAVARLSQRARRS